MKAESANSSIFYMLKPYITERKSIDIDRFSTLFITGMVKCFLNNCSRQPLFHFNTNEKLKAQKNEETHQKSPSSEVFNCKHMNCCSVNKYAEQVPA